jgi:hypothetical protein
VLVVEVDVVVVGLVVVVVGLVVVVVVEGLVVVVVQGTPPAPPLRPLPAPPAPHAPEALGDTPTVAATATATPAMAPSTAAMRRFYIWPLTFRLYVADDATQE